jgi:hypothetical protein
VVVLVEGVFCLERGMGFWHDSFGFLGSWTNGNENDIRYTRMVLAPGPYGFLSSEQAAMAFLGRFGFSFLFFS